MDLVVKEDYFQWQKRLNSNKYFRIWWQFWSNYSWLFLLPIVFYLIYYSNADKNIIVKVVLAFIVARIIFVPIISKLFPKARPYQQYNFQPLESVFLSKQTKSKNSFPSSHVISITAASGAMLLSQPILAIIFFVVAIPTGLGRVVLGFHYPKDVIFSLFFGLIIGIILSVLI